MRWISTVGVFKMTNKSVKVPAKVDLGSDCTLRNSRSIAASLAGLVNPASGVEIDCGAVELADITFVQMMISAEKTFAARDLPFTLVAATESVRSAFERAGVLVPGTGPFETSRPFEPSRN